MKKLFPLLFIAAVAASCLSSCNEDEEPTDDIHNMVSPEGSVWRSGKYFISLGDNNFLTAYIGDNFIDDGTYSYSKYNHKFTCNNTYYNHTTTYDIDTINAQFMRVKITYEDAFGNVKEKTMSFDKYIHDEESAKDNVLIGKSYTYNSYYFDNVTYRFDTYNTGSKMSDKNNIRKYPLNFHYIYFDGCIYCQYQHNEFMPSIGGWGPAFRGEVEVSRITLNNGMIVDIEDVSSSML